MQGEELARDARVAEAEGCFLRAKKPELALAMYRRAGLWEDALRVCEDYLPAKVSLHVLQLNWIDNHDH